MGRQTNQQTPFKRMLHFGKFTLFSVGLINYLTFASRPCPYCSVNEPLMCLVHEKNELSCIAILPPFTTPVWYILSWHVSNGGKFFKDFPKKKKKKPPHPENVVLNISYTNIVLQSKENFETGSPKTKIQ